MTCLPLVTDRLHICLSRDVDVCIMTAFQSDGTCRAGVRFRKYMCENKMQDLFLPLFLYTPFIPSVKVKLIKLMNALDGCIVFRFLFFFFFYGCQVDSSRLLLGLSLIVVSTVCEQKVGEYLIANPLTRPVFKPFFIAVGSY